MSKKPIIAAGLDLGSTYSRCAILLLENNHVRCLGTSSLRSEGWVKSRVADRQAVSACALKTVQIAEEMAGVQIESITVGCGGNTVHGANTRSRMDSGRPREIEQRDINRAFERAARVQLREDQMLLQLLPQDFVVDDIPGYHDPRRMMASSLEVNAHLILFSAQEHGTITGAVNHAHLKVDETVFEAMAACYATVLPEERREGLAVIDIGSQSTGLVAYYGDALQLASTVVVSGDHFTRDIAHFFRITYDDAELVKEQCGSARSDLTASNSVIDLPCAGGRESREMPRRKLNQIIEARAEELFELVKAELARVRMERALTGGVVLTGGASRLHGLCDIAERVLNCPARLGLPVGIANLPEDLEDPSWAVPAGLALYSARLQSQVDLERQSIGLIGRILR